MKNNFLSFSTALPINYFFGVGVQSIPNSSQTVVERVDLAGSLVDVAVRPVLQLVDSTHLLLAGFLVVAEGFVVGS